MSARRPARPRRLGVPAGALVGALLGVLPAVLPGAGGHPASEARSGAAEPDPWRELAAVREGLAEASPLAVPFVQTYVPAGFSTGDSESGTLAMELPDCLRWDYLEPLEKSYLLCGELAWSWNAGESSGRRQLLESDDLFGLDLLRRSVEELRRRYRAEIARRDGERVELRLEPLDPAGEVRDARLELDRASRRLLTLAYRDAEGNLTRFELGDYRRVDDAGELFAPPAEIEWLED